MSKILIPTKINQTLSNYLFRNYTQKPSDQEAINKAVFEKVLNLDDRDLEIIWTEGVDKDNNKVYNANFLQFNLVNVEAELNNE